MTLIQQVNFVSVDINKSNPPQLAITAIGMVSTAGWSNGRLVPRVYVTPPEDGLQDFDFYADPPFGNVAQVISSIMGTASIEMYAWLKGIRVHAQLNFVEEKFAQPNEQPSSNRTINAAPSNILRHYALKNYSFQIEVSDIEDYDSAIVKYTDEHGEQSFSGRSIYRDLTFQGLTISVIINMTRLSLVVPPGIVPSDMRSISIETFAIKSVPADVQNGQLTLYNIFALKGNAWN